MKKRIKVSEFKAQFTLGYAGLQIGMDDWLGDRTSDPNGIMIDTEVITEDVRDWGLRYVNDYAKDHITLTDEELLTPPEPDPDEPDPSLGKTRVVRIMNTGAKMSWDGEPYDKFVFPKLGPEYTQKPFTIVFSDGNRLDIPNPARMAMTPDNMKYQPGGEYSGHNPDIPTMEVYARYGTHPTWVEARFSHPVDNTPTAPSVPQPQVPTDGSRTFTVNYGDNPYLGKHGNDNRSRTWWTDLHGREGNEKHEWTQKYPLPKWVDDRAYVLKVTASDGQSFQIRNTAKETVMLSGNGPKYRKQTENTPGKNHPKLGMVYDTKTTWIKVVAVPL